MTLDVGALRNLLCERLCEDVRLDERPDGELMLRTHFSFPARRRLSLPSGRSAAQAASACRSCGHTLMHIS